MTGRELAEAVARARGWRHLGCGLWVNPSDVALWDRDILDWSLAGELLEEMGRELPRSIFLRPSHGGGWHCGHYGEQWWHGATGPEAIAAAWLAWHESTARASGERGEER